MIKNQAGMTREYSRIRLKVIWVLEQLSKVDFGTSKLIFEFFQCIFWILMSIFESSIAYYWTCPYLAVPPHVIWLVSKSGSTPKLKIFKFWNTYWILRNWIAYFYISQCYKYWILCLHMCLYHMWPKLKISINWNSVSAFVTIKNLIGVLNLVFMI